MKVSFTECLADSVSRKTLPFLVCGKQYPAFKVLLAKSSL